MFIASTSEGMAVSLALHRKLETSLGVTLWSWDVGNMNRFSIDRAKTLISTSDIAVFVSSTADVACLRTPNREAGLRTEETLFLLGIMVGALGPNRVFWVMPDEEGAPAAVAHRLGIHKFYFDGHRRDINAAISDASCSLQEAVKEIGLRTPLGPPEGGLDMVRAWLGK